MDRPKNTLLILGSGATAGGFNIKINNQPFNPPTDAYFFDNKPDNIVKRFYIQEDFPVLYFFQQFQASKSLEQTWSDIDLTAKLTNNQLSQLRVISMAHEYKNEELKHHIQNKAKTISEFKNNLNSQLAWVGEAGCLGPLASWEAVELILKIFSLEMLHKPEVLKFMKYVLSKTHLSGIATFNYDTSLESMWNKSDLNEKLYYYDPYHSSGFTNSIPLFKMHGSINWASKFVPTNKVRWVYTIPDELDTKPVPQKFNQGSFINGEPDEIEEPTIIPPDSFKQNITLDIQNDPKSVLFKKIWNRVWETLNGVDNLIFIGFSFPETDRHARLLFKLANKRKAFGQIIVNTEHEKSFALKNYDQIFGKNKYIHISGGILNLCEEIKKFIN